MTSEAIKCPCCGQAAPAGKVSVDINDNMLYFGEEAWKLHPRLAELAFILARRMPHTVPHEVIRAQMWGGTDVLAESSLSVAVMQLRKMLPPGLRIVTNRGTGYRMAQVSKTERRPSPSIGAEHARA